MRVGPHGGGEVDCNGGQFLPKRRARTGVNHLPLQANVVRNLLELFAVPMGAVIHSVNELMGERVEHLDGVCVHGADEDLVDAIVGRLAAPALAHGAAPARGTWNGARHTNPGHLIALCSKERRQGINSKQ